MGSEDAWQMKLKDFRRLRKFMAMTTSENDGEALAALRMANRVIASSGVTWDRFFDRAVRVEIEPTPENSGRHDATHTPGDEAEDIKSAFRSIDRNRDRWSEKREETIESLRRWYADKGSLTEKQKGLLFVIEQELSQ